MYTNIFYQNNFHIIGGVETFLFELSKLVRANGRDLTIIYRRADAKQVERIRKYCPILKYDDIEKPIKCKRAFFNYGLDIIDNVEAEEYIQIIHADFKSKMLKNYPLIQSPKITKYYAVSENNAKSFRELTGEDIDVLYNPITIEDEQKAMTLISPQRLSGEKGVHRIEEMVRRLDATKLPYVWHIFADKEKLNVDSPNVMYHKPDLNVRRWIKSADYLVLLSDTEGFPYSVYESLCLGTPVIITKLLMLDELGITKDNAIVVDFDLSNLDVYDIYNRAGKFKFKYTKKEDGWLNLLPEKSEYEYKTVKVKAVQSYYDTCLDIKVNIGEITEVPIERANMLVNRKFAEYAEE